MADEDKGALVERAIRQIKIALKNEPFRDSPSWKDYEVGFRALASFLIEGPSPESELVEEPDAEEPAAANDNVLQFPAPDLTASAEPAPEAAAPPPEEQATPPADVPAAEQAPSDEPAV